MRSPPLRLVGTLGLVLLALVYAGCGGSDPDGGAADEQTITFQQPEDPGPDPFTEPADLEGEATVPVSATAGGDEQPFGGSGSNRVCDRDKLIRFLRDNPDRMAEWARVLGVRPDFRSVRRYIARLHPVTLTRDTQVTNHAYRDGRAVPFQAILQAGTAVLVDRYGVPVVRCFCGNPLGPAVFTPHAKCTGCPENYKPPRQCEFERGRDHDKTYYEGDYYDNADYDEVFIRTARSKCYQPYPDPPKVTVINVYRAPPEAEPAFEPEPEPEPETLDCDAPRSQLEFEQCAAMEPHEPEPEPAPDAGLQCDPPRSQLEAEQCAALEGNAPQYEPTPEPAPAPDPNYDCPDMPPAHPGEDYLRNCG